MKNQENNNEQNQNETPIKKSGRPRGKNPYRKPRVYQAKAANGSTRWILDLRLHDGKRQRKFYDTKEEAETAQQIEHRRLTNEGLAGASIEPGLREEAIKCRKLLEGTGASLEEAVRFFLSLRPKTEEKSLEAAALAFNENRKQKGSRSRYLETCRSHLRQFTTALHGQTPIHTILEENIEKYLDKQKTWAPKTKNGHLGTLRTFFDFAIAKGWARENPVLGIEKARVGDLNPCVYTPREAQTLLDAAREHQPEILALLAIGMFGGVRTTELLQLRREWLYLDLKEPCIFIHGDIAKTRARRMVPVSPSLAAWLAVAKLPESGPLWTFKDGAFRFRTAALTQKTKLDWKQNGMRHSFASYHLAHHQNETMTALATGHTPQVLHKHYKFPVLTETAANYWKIVPEEMRQDPEWKIEVGKKAA